MYTKWKFSIFYKYCYLYTYNIFMDFLLTYKSHFINRMTEHIITTGAAVTWIIWESGEKEKYLIFYSFLFVGSILIKHILWGTVSWH